MSLKKKKLFYSWWKKQIFFFFKLLLLVCPTFISRRTEIVLCATFSKMAKLCCRLQTRKRGSDSGKPQTQFSLELWVCAGQGEVIRDQGSPAIDPLMLLYVDFLRLGVTDFSRNENWNPPSFYGSPPAYFLKACCVSTSCWASRSSPSVCVPGPGDSLWPDVCSLLLPCLCMSLPSLECCFPYSQTLTSYRLAHLSGPGLGFAFYRDFLQLLLSWLLPPHPCKKVWLLRVLVAACGLALIRDCTQAPRLGSTES